MAQVELSIIPGKSPYTPNMSPGEPVYCGLRPAGLRPRVLRAAGLNQPPEPTPETPTALSLSSSTVENFQGELNVEKTAWEALITLRACDSQTLTML